jgi:hypothetical protein
VEETSLRGDGGILLLVLLLLYGSAGCIIAPDGDMFHGSPSGCGEDVVYLCGDDSEKRKKLKTFKFRWNYKISMSTEIFTFKLSVQTCKSHSDG